MSIGWESTDHGWEDTTVGWESDSGVTVSNRGQFMGYTLPGSGLTSGLAAIAQNQSHVGWLRCGDPEISNSSITGGVLNAGFLASVASQVAIANSHGLGLVFSVLGVPTSVNAASGTGGNNKYWPTNGTGDTFMANCCAQIATVLMDSTRSTGIQNAITYLQEPNIPQFNPGTQSAARWADATLAYIDAVRAAEPDIIVYAGDVANRGDYRTTAPADVGWTGPSFIAAAIAHTPALLSPAHAPDYWGYHPYVYPTSPLADKGWGVPQMDAFAFTLLAAGAQKPSGAPAQVSVTEYGAPFTGTGYTQATQKQALTDYITAFDTRRAAGWLAGPELYYTIASGDSKALYVGTTPTQAGSYFETVALRATSGPVAAFGATSTALTVTFTDASIGATGWTWTFGDGGTSTSQNPSHTYASAGTYTVTLTATNGAGSTSVSHPVTVPAGLAANFDVVPNAGAAPLFVTFTDTSSGAPTSWAWTFGDGGTSTSQNPTHTYAATGTYSVTLSATKAGVTVTNTKFVLVGPPAAPVAHFGFTPFSGPAPLTVSFTDTSTGGPTSWLWDFGDGTTASTQNPVHVYTTPGFYTIVLTVTNGLGSDGETFAISVGPATVPPPVPAARIRLELGLRPGARADTNRWFTLGTSTLGGPDPLAPDYVYFDLDGMWTDITFTHGYNQERGAIQPGTINATLENVGRQFDKRNTLSPYYPMLTPPAVRLRLYVDDIILGTVIVDSLNPQYSIDENPAPISGADALSMLARTPIRFHARTHKTEQRLNRILDHAGWRDPRFIPPGAFHLGTYDIDANALDEINNIAQAEDTLVFANPDNIFVFTPRANLYGSAIFTFADDGTGDADYKQIHYSDGNATFANAIRVTRRASNTDDHPRPQGYSDWDSINNYTNGVPVELDITDSPVVDDGSALLQAIQIGSRYASPVDRIDSLTLDLTDFDPTVRAQLLQLGLGSPVLVKHTPHGGGPQNSQVSVVIGRTLSINADHTHLEMTYRFRAMDGGI